MRRLFVAAFRFPNQSGRRIEQLNPVTAFSEPERVDTGTTTDINYVCRRFGKMTVDQLACAGLLERARAKLQPCFLGSALIKLGDCWIHPPTSRYNNWRSHTFTNTLHRFDELGIGYFFK